MLIAGRHRVVPAKILNCTVESIGRKREKFSGRIEVKYFKNSGLKTMYKIVHALYNKDDLR